MQSTSSNGWTVHALAGEDIKASWQPGRDIQQQDSKTWCSTLCWASAVTIMPFFPITQPITWRRDETVAKETERLAYNRRIETMRLTEYPMLRGKPLSWPWR